MIGNLTYPGLCYVMAHLRAADRREAGATVAGIGGPENVCAVIWSVPGPKWEARTDEGTPAVVGGFTPVWPGLASGWLWGTDEWDLVGREVTRFVKGFILPALDEAGFHRIECRPIAGNDLAQRWLKLIGFRQEAVTAQFGQGREDFVLWARIKGNDQAWIH
jgi:hypothetical protein